MPIIKQLEDVCPRCNSRDLSDLDFDIKECLECGKQFKPSVELIRNENRRHRKLFSLEKEHADNF